MDPLNDRLWSARTWRAGNAGGWAAGALAIVLVLLGDDAAAPAAGSGRAMSVANRLTASHSRLTTQRQRSITVGAPSGCTADFSPYFVGFAANGNYAGSNSSGASGEGFAGVGAGDLNEACDQYTFIGGGARNTAGGDGQGSFSMIGAGYFNQIEAGRYAFIGAGYGNSIGSTPEYTQPGNYNYLFDDAIVSGEENKVGSPFSAIVGGLYNTVAPSASAPQDSTAGTGFIGGGGYNNDGANFSSIVGGNGNTIGTATVNAGDYGFIGGGSANLVSGEYGVVTGGEHNLVSGQQAFIGAGDQNTVSSAEAFLGSGASNNVTSGASYGVINGGYGNYLSGQKGVVGGGEDNRAEGSFSTVPGGYKNEALGNESFAAGSQAQAKFTGSFVWSDYASGEAPLNDGEADQFVVRASGGVYFYSNIQSPYTGVMLAPGSGTWASVSDRHAKTDIVPLDDASILAKVDALPISSWHYKTEQGVKHLGPMAQDFYAAFGVGEDDKHITSIDEDGVALAAIKALDQKLETKEHENGVLASRLARLEAMVRNLVATRK